MVLADARKSPQSNKDAHGMVKRRHFQALQQSNDKKQDPSFQRALETTGLSHDIARISINAPSRTGRKAEASQTKLAISQPGDVFEQEADRVAEQIMRMSAVEGEQRLRIPAGMEVISRKCPKCREDDEKLLQAKENAQQSNATSYGLDASQIAQDVCASSGWPLDTATRMFMEQHFGYDFSRVRVHNDARASESARAVNALAYTLGPNIVFGFGSYSPETSRGRRLLAHELTHVVQQGSATSKADGTLHGSAQEISGRTRNGVTGLSANKELPFRLGKSSNCIQRYGHTKYCTNSDHLKPFIWPGHDHARKVIQQTLLETDGRALRPIVDTYLKIYFGKESTNPANLSKIHANFRKIRSALEEEYLYHCSRKGDRSDSDARECKGQNAETDPDGRKDITLCFDRCSGWSMPEAAWLIIHENVHRGLDVWDHSWIIGRVNGCLNRPPIQEALDLKNPDSYACLAVLI
jgi:hypothetical protein